MKGLEIPFCHHNFFYYSPAFLIFSLSSSSSKTPLQYKLLPWPAVPPSFPDFFFYNPNSYLSMFRHCIHVNFPYCFSLICVDVCFLTGSPSVKQFAVLQVCLLRENERVPPSLRILSSSDREVIE